MKMYILIKQGVPANFVPVIAAHSSLACYLKFQNDPHCIKWVNGIFKKVVCEVSEDEFEVAKQYDRHMVITESALGGVEVALAFCPREYYPEIFKSFPLWRCP
jgi:hypothetical protein